MKKLLAIITSIAVAILTFTASSYAWFSTKTVINFPSSYGSTQTAYFAGGDGSKESPYLISSPVHLYNLAWLQYLGYFNLKSGFNNGRAQNYFKLKNSINLQNVVIPPIGTSEYPFIGSFDGNGQILTNVTVSNVKTDFNQRPANSKFDESDNLEISTGGDVSIVGLFGVTGDYNSFISNNYTSVNVKDALTAPSEPESDVLSNDFYYSAMQIKNFYADNLTVISKTPKTLVGIIAGYVCSTVQNTGAYGCGFQLNGGATGLNETYQTTVSKYSIVGDYAEDIVGWSEKPVDTSSGEGDGATWGGSIDMLSLNRRINYIISKSGTISSVSALSVNDTSYGLNAYRNSKKLYWNDSTKGYQFIYLTDGTVLPLNVDKEAMGLNVGDEGIIKSTKITVDDKEVYKYPNGLEGFYINDYYYNNTTEIVSDSNTGYMVSDGKTNGGYIRSRIQSLTFDNVSQKGGIYKSLGYTGDNNDYKNCSIYDETHKKRFEMLTIAFNADETYNTYRIKDDVNKDNVNTVFSGVTQKSYVDLNLGGYATVRSNFDETMLNSYNVHGFHFMNKISTTDYNTVYKTVKLNGNTYNNYPLIKGGINFTISQSGSIKTILGAYYSSSDYNTLFDLYRVVRSEHATGGYSIKTFERISKIYKDSSGNVVYNPTDINGLTLVFDFDAVTKTALLEKNAAYYFEIPVSAGDYFIGSNKENSDANAYLMYLDIGGNGDVGGDTPNSEAMPYNISMVDFVSISVSDDELSVPTTSGGVSYYPHYQDVTFNLSGLSGEVARVNYRREKYADGTLPNTEQTPITTAVKYYFIGAVVKPTSVLGQEDSNLQNW